MKFHDTGPWSPQVQPCKHWEKWLAKNPYRIILYVISLYGEHGHECITHAETDAKFNNLMRDTRQRKHRSNENEHQNYRACCAGGTVSGNLPTSHRNLLVVSSNFTSFNLHLKSVVSAIFLLWMLELENNMYYNGSDTPNEHGSSKQLSPWSQYQFQIRFSITIWKFELKYQIYLEASRSLEIAWKFKFLHDWTPWKTGIQILPSKPPLNTPARSQT